MAMFLLLFVVNVCCFLPHYLLNARERPNPFQFLRPEHASDTRGIKLLYTKLPFSDPFRINADYTLAVLALGYFGWDGGIAQALASALLVFGIIEISYTSLMQSVFKRAPVLGSDLALLRAGVAIIKGRLALALVAPAVVLVLLCFAAFSVTGVLLAMAPSGNPVLLLAGAALLPSCFYNLHKYPYQKVIYRTVYSPSLHLLRNLEVGGDYRAFIEQDRDAFAAMNQFKSLTLTEHPNVVFLCIESYGGIVHSDDDMAARLAGPLDRLASRIQSGGLTVASALSEAPIFSGGSWLSYTTFTYGLRIDDVVVHDRLFAEGSAFEAYESVFHVLHRNGYRNYLLCPLGGVADHDVDWARIQRNFQADVMLDYESLGYRGPRLPYLGLDHRHAPPDQFSLFEGYSRAAAESDQPFSLFFLTLNSHFPYDSPVALADDWRGLNSPDAPLARSSESGGDTAARYAAALTYQLDLVTQLLVDHGDDNTVFVLFGDHQPPFVATDSMGLSTPVHVISSNAALVAPFVAAGYTASLRPDTGAPRIVRHEDFMGVFLAALEAQYGAAPVPEVVAR